MVRVEFVVAGPLGDLAAWAFADLVVERTQVLVTSTDDLIAALDRLDARGVEVLTVRERPLPSDLSEAEPKPTRHG